MEAKVQFPILNRVQKIISVVALISALSFIAIGFRSPDHKTPQQSVSVRINGVVRYMTPTQKHIFDASFVVFVVCCFVGVSVGWYVRDMSE